MAQLPPKVPNMTYNWYPSPHQSVSFNNAAAAAMSLNNNPSSWVDDFLDFSSVRRGSHRRSISDSVAFLDPQATSFADECRNVSDNNVNNDTGTAVNMSSADASCGFDRFDDDQLMSMFSDDLSLPAPPTASSSNPSTPSDQNSNNDERTTSLDHHHHHHHHHHIHPKNEPGEADSCGQNESQATHQQQPSPPAASNGDTIIDPKRVKRILANRQSAQRSRVRKLQYISELERSVTSLQTEVSALSPRVAFFDHQRLILNVDNSALKQRIAALAQDKIFKDAHQEALKKEIERLRQVHHHQNIKKMNSNSNDNAAPPQQQQRPPSQSQSQPPPPMSADTICYT